MTSSMCLRHWRHAGFIGTHVASMEETYETEYKVLKHETRAKNLNGSTKRIKLARRLKWPNFNGTIKYKSDKNVVNQVSLLREER